MSGNEDLLKINELYEQNKDLYAFVPKFVYYNARKPEDSKNVNNVMWLRQAMVSWNLAMLSQDKNSFLISMSSTDKLLMAISLGLLLKSHNMMPNDVFDSVDPTNPGINYNSLIFPAIKENNPKFNLAMIADIYDMVALLIVKHKLRNVLQNIVNEYHNMFPARSNLTNVLLRLTLTVRALVPPMGFFDDD